MRSVLTRLVLLAGASLVVGCSSHAVPTLPTVPPLPQGAAASAVPQVGPGNVEDVEDVEDVETDPVEALIKTSESLFVQGQAELMIGHLGAARVLFDRAVDILLTAPDGARAESRMRSQFDRLLGRISALEILALREGDGFTLTRTEAAVIDGLLEVTTPTLPEPTEATVATVAADLAETAHDLPIENNARVQSFIELFQGNLHEFMQESLQRSAQYLPMVQDIFRSEGVPLDLAYLAIVESGYKNNALSRASARGMWQFMPATGREHGLEQNWFLDERSDPEKSTRAAAQYLKALNLTFDGDWNLAMASYNAGPGRLKSAVRRSKANDYWTITATSKYLPRETRNYVPMIMAAVLIAKNPEAYGFEAVEANPLVYDRVTIPDAIDLRTVAEWTDVTIEEIRALNPELRRTTTPVGPHDLKVPVGTGPIVEGRLATADPSIFAKFVPYQIKRGDTLSAIARKAGFRASDLASANNIRLNSRLSIGQILMIPRVVSAALASRPSESAASGPVTYRVRRGDTLSGIAKRFDTTVSNIKRWNSLTSSRIDVGDRLTIHRD